MIKFLKLFLIMSAALLAGCQQQSFDCEKQNRKIQVLEQKLAARVLPIKRDDAKLNQQLEQVTLDLIKVKVQRDLLKQELTALRKYKQKN